MGKDYKDLFVESRNLELPPGLLAVVLGRISLEKKRSAQREFALVGSVALGSLVAIIPTFSYLVSSLIQSSFYQYFSLILSDGVEALAYWKEILMSLLESLPLFPVIVFLSILVVFLWSVARATRDAKLIFLPA